MTPRVLVAGHGRACESIAHELADPLRGIEIDTFGHPRETILKVSSGDYAVIVCPAASQSDLDEIAQLRRAGPNLPILLVSSVTDPDFRRRAFGAGATTIAPSARDVAALAEYLVHSVRMNRVATVLEARATTAQDLTRDIHRLIRDQRAIVGSNSYLVRASRKSRLRPLLVAEDPEGAFRVLRAFERADVFSPLPLLRSVDEVIAYLNGCPPFADRSRYPLPNLILIDFEQSRAAALELLAWIRGQAQLVRTPVVVLSDMIEPEFLRRAYSLHANSYLVKPGDFEDLVEMAKAIDLYWSSINFGLELL